MKGRKRLEALFDKHGCKDFKWFDPKNIVVAQWVRMKCRFGCKDYGKVAACPPNVPALEECERFFKEYNAAAILHFSKAVKKPADRHAWTRSINNKLLKLERDVFISGREKAFVLFVDPCNLCKTCSDSPADCKKPRDSRPSPEALGVDVFSTAKKCGFEIRVLSDYTQEMNRFGMLLVE